MLKTANVNDLKSMNDRKVFYGMQKVFEDSGEGRFFSMQAGARKQRKKLSWNHWQARGVLRLLHNVIIVHLIILLKIESFFMHYNATLCN